MSDYLGQKRVLAINSDLADPERFGTIVGHEGTFTIVVPFNEKMRLRALSQNTVKVPDKVLEVWR